MRFPARLLATSAVATLAFAFPAAGAFAAEGDVAECVTEGPGSAAGTPEEPEDQTGNTRDDNGGDNGADVDDTTTTTDPACTDPCDEVGSTGEGTDDSDTDDTAAGGDDACTDPCTEVAGESATNDDDATDADDATSPDNCDDVECPPGSSVGANGTCVLGEVLVNPETDENPQPAPVPVTAPEVLTATGVDSDVLAIVAVGAIALGGGAIYASRRKKTPVA